VIRTSGPCVFAEQTLARFRDQELQARSALEAGDPKALCALGWHRCGSDDAETADDPLAYFRFENVIGEAGGSLVFRVAAGPFLYQSNLVKHLGNLRPWSCSVCGQDVGPG
jgi:hypothetical protein